jgi:integrase/recombinase XerC
MSDGKIVPRRSIGALADELIAEEDIWADFLSLQISPNTKRTYASALDHFFRQLTGEAVNPRQIQEFLNLSADGALAVVLRYRALLLDLNLAPNTINTRLAAIKSLVNHARKLHRCAYSLEDVTNVKVQKYRDTSGVDAHTYRQMLAEIDRSTMGGKRDYAIMRLLWDNALRQSEITQLNIEDWKVDQLWICRKGKLERQSVSLAVKTMSALEDWLRMRDNPNPQDPLFIALDNRAYGNRLSGRSLSYLVDRLATDVGITKPMSTHRIRHSSITAYLDLSDGNVRNAQQLSGHAKLETLVIYDDRRRNLQQSASISLSDLV